MKPENLTCPECGGPMISRLNQAKQQRFWGCRQFPRCKGTRDTDGNSPTDRYVARQAERDWPDDPRGDEESDE